MSVVEVVMVETKNGPIEINKCDFDKEKHKLVASEVAKAKAPTPKKVERKPTMSGTKAK